MIIRDIFREIYYYKIKKMSPMQFRIFHLKRIGMEIGEGCKIYSDRLETNEPYLIKIGSDVMISPEVALLTHDASACYYLPDATDLFGRITIGDHCFLGYGAILLPGVSIADHCIVGAGSVVTKSFNTPGMVIAGNPAKEIGSLEQLREKNEPYSMNVHGKGSRKAYLLANEDKFIGARK